jgi:hypothetical protein
MDLLDYYNLLLQVVIRVSRMCTAAHKVFYFLSSRCLVTAPNDVDSSAPVFLSLPAGDSLAIPHGRNS